MSLRAFVVKQQQSVIADDINNATNKLPDLMGPLIDGELLMYSSC